MKRHNYIGPIIVGVVMMLVALALTTRILSQPAHAPETTKAEAPLGASIEGSAEHLAWTFDVAVNSLAWAEPKTFMPMLTQTARAFGLSEKFILPRVIRIRYGERFFLEELEAHHFEALLAFSVLPTDGEGNPITCIGEYGFAYPLRTQHGVCFCQQGWMEVGEAGSDAHNMADPWVCAKPVGAPDSDLTCVNLLTHWTEWFGSWFYIINIDALTSGGCVYERNGILWNSVANCVNGCGETGPG